MSKGVHSALCQVASEKEEYEEGGILGLRGHQELCRGSGWPGRHAPENSKVLLDMRSLGS